MAQIFIDAEISYSQNAINRQMKIYHEVKFACNRGIQPVT